MTDRNACPELADDETPTPAMMPKRLRRRVVLLVNHTPQPERKRSKGRRGGRRQ